MAEIKLKRCPFCKSDELSHGSSWPPEQGAVQCHECGGAMVADTEAEAIAAWNRRPSPVESELKPVAWQWRQTFEGKWSGWNLVLDEAGDSPEKWQGLAERMPNEIQVRPLYTHPAPRPSPDPDIEGLDDAGDALTLRSYIKEFGETPSMTASRALAAESARDLLAQDRDGCLELMSAQNSLVGKVWEVLGGQDMHREGGQDLLRRVTETIAARDLLAAERDKAVKSIGEMKAWATHCGVNIEQSPVHILSDLQLLREADMAKSDLLTAEVERLRIVMSEGHLTAVLDKALEARNVPAYGHNRGDWVRLNHREIVAAIARAALTPSTQGAANPPQGGAE